jgi:hypothetical protein
LMAAHRGLHRLSRRGAADIRSRGDYFPRLSRNVTAWPRSAATNRLKLRSSAG